MKRVYKRTDMNSRTRNSCQLHITTPGADSLKVLGVGSSPWTHGRAMNRSLFPEFTHRLTSNIRLELDTCHVPTTLNYFWIYIARKRFWENSLFYCVKFLHKLRAFFEGIVSSEACRLTLRRLMSYIHGAPILDVSRSHTTTQHSR